MAPLVKANLAAGLLGSLFLVSGTAVVILWLQLSTAQGRLDACRADKAAAGASVAAMKGVIETQNRKVREAQGQAERMRAQGDAARSQANIAAAETQRAIERLRAEQAASQSCEEVRQRLIQEVIGYVVEQE